MYARFVAIAAMHSLVLPTSYIMVEVIFIQFCDANLTEDFFRLVIFVALDFVTDRCLYVSSECIF